MCSLAEIEPPGLDFAWGVVKRRCERVEEGPSELDRVGLRWPPGFGQTFALGHASQNQATEARF